MKNLSLLILISISTFSCTESKQAHTLQSKIDSLVIKNDSLSDVLEKEKTKSNYWYDPIYDGEKFFDIGINDPVAYIERSLRQKPELIPLRAVLGGKMSFGSIQLLSSEWLIADYNDGHIAGRAIYKYSLTNNGTLQFELIKSIGPE